MRSEKLDRRLIIQEPAETRDDYGQEVLTWSTFATVWAGVKLNIGKESFQTSERVKERVVDFKVRYRTDITANMRLLYDSNYYEIEDVVELGREDGLIIRGSRIWQT
jgi:SPP1 family predicted phage head-tail adaptor